MTFLFYTYLMAKDCSLMANNYEQFQVLVNNFEKTDFIKRLRVSRSCMIAEFYLKNKAYDKAIDLFNLLAENHPDSERPLKGLVDSYKHLIIRKRPLIILRKWMTYK